MDEERCHCGKIRDSIEDYYVKLYTESFPDWLVVEGVEFDCISEEQQRWLERPFLEEDVRVDLNSMEEDKAPGPNGFPTKF